MENQYEYMVYQLINKRRELNISQEELSFTIGCSKDLVSKWERFIRQPSGFMLGCWVQSLGLQIQITERRIES